ncbi:conserved domain protein [Paraprevotella xylaniphila YIT 11841]|uniref:Conserved domain protein n=1 Tax=Paraprevotella xylaniphila YIT 11841 TaxID=762982 RepID=F3QX67_9BACT|nr:conserved domain protein [Paraprevotella xylaniphila YIT 11841]
MQGKERKEQSGPQEREEYGIAAFHAGVFFTKLRKMEDNGMDLEI